MCDYSLHQVASRPARVGDKLVTTRFPNTITRGFASVDEPHVAVCLLPGTELAFEKEVQCETGIVFAWRLGHAVARFKQVNKGQSNVHHDALEFPDGKIVLLDEVVQRPTRDRIAITGRREWHGGGEATAEIARDVMDGL